MARTKAQTKFGWFKEPRKPASWSPVSRSQCAGLRSRQRSNHGGLGVNFIRSVMGSHSCLKLGGTCSSLLVF